MNALALELFLAGFVVPVAAMILILYVAKKLRQRQEHRSRPRLARLQTPTLARRAASTESNGGA